MKANRGVLEARAMMIASAHSAARKAGRAVYWCGNGGSAADSQHMAAELCVRFYLDRPPLNSAALTTNTSALTAVANDYAFDQVFSRQVRAYGRRGDVLIGISTSGGSRNVLAALKEARRIGMKTVGLTSTKGLSMRRLCDILLAVPATDVARIQEGHALLSHVICARAEATLFPRQARRARSGKPA